MSWRGYATVAVEVAVFVVVAALVVGQVLGQPVLLSYVTTGSMAGTIDPGDGFVAIPVQLAGPVREGDIVTYQAEKLHNGGLTTHRIVGKTARGYVTKGDANPFTDQDGPEPPVNPAQLKAVAWRPGGHVLVIPHLGTAAMAVKSGMAGAQRWLAITLGDRSLLGTQGLAYGLFGLTAVGYVVDYLLSGGESPERERTRGRGRSDGVSARAIVLALALVLVAVATASMVVPGGQQKFGVVAADTDAPGLHVVKTGTTERTRYPIVNSGVLPTYVFFETHNPELSVTPARLTVPGRSMRNATLAVTAPRETGYYRLFLTEHRYLPLLPRETVYALYEVNPWLPIVVEDLEIGVPFALVGAALVGSGRIHRRSRDRPSASLAGRISRLLSGLV